MNSVKKKNTPPEGQVLDLKYTAQAVWHGQPSWPKPTC